MKILLLLFFIFVSIYTQGQTRQSANAMIKIKIVNRTAIQILSSKEYNKSHGKSKKNQRNSLNGKREVLMQYVNWKKTNYGTENFISTYNNSDKYYPDFKVINSNEDIIGQLNSVSRNLVSGISKNDKISFIYSGKNQSKKSDPFSIIIVY